MRRKCSRLFEGLVIDWKSNEFFRARIKLTIFYAIIIAALIVLFSGTLWFEINEIHDNFHQEKIIESNELFLDEFTDEFADKILLIDIFVFILTTFLSYFLAGKNLQPIAKKMKQQAQFIEDAAHEIKNPLAAIFASGTSILRVKEISDKQSREVLGEILEESNRLISLTSQLLQFKDKEHVSLEEVQVKKIVEKIIQTLQPLLLEKKIILDTHLVNFSLSMAESDFESIVFNLLHNAIKFSHKEGKIIIRLEKEKKLSIQDFGIGLSEKEIPFIFDRFYKADKARTFGANTGSGLGLSIVKNIIHFHNGKIRVDRGKTAGCVFTVTFK